MDRRLLEQLYQKYYRELYLYIYGFCKNTAQAEDLLQETFLKAILSLPDKHSNMRAWLYRVARNLTFNALKKKDAFPEEHMAAENEPLAMILQKEKYRQLYQALQLLPKIQREILIMQYFGKLSHKEIASILNMSPSAVRMAASRARNRLKLYLEEEK